MPNPFSPEKLEQVRGLIARLANEFAIPPTRSGSPAPTTTRGSQIAKDLNFNVNVRVVADAGLRADEPTTARCAPRSGSVPLADPLLSLTPAELSKLRNLDKQAIEWIAASPNNAATFILDPIRAMEASGVAIDRTLLKNIGRKRNDPLASRALPPGVRVARLTVKGKPAMPFSRGRSRTRPSGD